MASAPQCLSSGADNGCYGKSEVFHDSEVMLSALKKCLTMDVKKCYAHEVFSHRFFDAIVMIP